MVYMDGKRACWLFYLFLGKRTKMIDIRDIFIENKIRAFFACFATKRGNTKRSEGTEDGNWNDKK